MNEQKQMVMVVGTKPTEVEKHLENITSLVKRSFAEIIFNSYFLGYFATLPDLILEFKSSNRIRIETIVIPARMCFTKPLIIKIMYLSKTFQNRHVHLRRRYGFKHGGHHRKAPKVKIASLPCNDLIDCF